MAKSKKQTGLIQITDKYRLRVFDELNIVAEKLVTVENRKTGEKRQEWQIDGYFYKLRRALNMALGCVAESLERDAVAEASDIKELIKKIDEIHTVIDRLKFKDVRVAECTQGD